MLAKSSDFWLDDCWIVDSTPVPCGMSRQTVKRSDLAGWAGYGYCASHSRFYWGLKLYLVCTPSGMPILWALADPKIGEREVLASMLEVEADMVTEHDGILLISDKGFAGRAFETLLEEHGVTLLRPSRKDEQARYGEPMLKPRERPPSPREAARWIITAPERVGPLIAQRLHRLLEHCPELRQTHDLVRQFASMLDARNAAPLPDWLDQLATSGLAPLAGIATALREDQQAVTQGITTPYNSGINEGRITDVKLQKRIMAGRAGVPLLRHRVVLIAHLRRRYAAPATAAPR
jgi:hypothetical protein